MYRIARRYGIGLAALIASNPQVQNPDSLVPGQVIEIPNSPQNLYVVQLGDTFYFIARRFNVPLSALIAANPGVDPTRLRIGQTLVIPAGAVERIVAPTGPYGFAEMMDDIDRLRARYPFLETRVIGNSVLGRQMMAIRLGRGSRRIHYNGSFHANEWITTPLLMQFIEDYAAAYTSGGTLRGVDVGRLFEETSLWMVPMVNPDGVELVISGITPANPYYEEVVLWNNGSLNFSTWKANIRGVDLNDQYPANWEEERRRRSPAGPGPRDYVGTAPLTEPEAVAIADFTREQDFALVIAFHTQGEVIFYNYRGLEPPESREIAERFQAVSGYQPIVLTESDAGYKDWFIQEFRRPGFTVEAGRGTNPLPIGQFPAIYEDVLGIMLEGLQVR